MYYLYLLYGFAPVPNISKDILEALQLKGGEYWPRAKPESSKVFSFSMYTFQFPPQNASLYQAKLDHYKEQTDEMLETTHELLLAYDLVKDYSQADASYYMDMYSWINSRYEYVISYSMTFLHLNYEKR